MYIENKKITSEHSVKLVNIEIDHQLNLDNLPMQKTGFPVNYYRQT